MLSVAKPNQMEYKLCTAKDFFVLAAMLVFLKGVQAWPPHTFLFKIISSLLNHIQRSCSEMLLNCVVFPTQQA